MQLRDHDAVLSKRDFFIVDPRRLKVDASYNVRDLTAPETREHIDALKESISANSVRVPLEVRIAADDIYIVAGHCRHVAVMELIAEGRDDIKGVPCFAEPKNTNDAERTLNLAISNSGKPLTTLEVAEVVRRLQGFGWTDEEIQKRMRWKSRASVAHHTEVAALPAAVKRHVRDGEVSASLAVKMMREEPEKCAELIRANQTENKRLGVGARMKNRVTPKSIARDRKAKAQKSDTEPEGNRGTRGKPDTGASPVVASDDGREPLPRLTDLNAPSPLNPPEVAVSAQDATGTAAPAPITAEAINNLLASFKVLLRKFENCARAHGNTDDVIADATAQFRAAIARAEGRTA